MFCPNEHCPDFEDTGIHGEYVDTIWGCPVCGTRLVPELPQQPTRAAPGDSDGAASEETGRALVAVASFNTRQDADVAASYLEAQGIRALVAPDDVGGAYGAVGFAAGYRVFVPEDLAGDAAALLERVDEG